MIKLNKKQKTVLARFMRVLLHGVVASLAALMASPEVLDLIGVQWTPVVVIIGTAFLNAVSKSLRYGEDEGEETGDSLFLSEN
jgi:hypothetical protein